MREILFRGKRVDNCEWIEGHYGKYMLMSGESISCISIPKKEAVCGSICYDVEASTVGQYTGLTDKNGEKIYEGDVLKGKFSNYVIRFDEEERAFVYGSSRKGGYIHSLAKYLIGDYKNLRVIGNIHDNPELITCGANSEK